MPNRTSHFFKKEIYKPGTIFSAKFNQSFYPSYLPQKNKSFYEDLHNTIEVRKSQNIVYLCSYVMTIVFVDNSSYQVFINVFLYGEKFIEKNIVAESEAETKKRLLDDLRLSC